jgi:hypothetical protein
MIMTTDMQPRTVAEFHRLLIANAKVGVPCLFGNDPGKLAMELARFEQTQGHRSELSEPYRRSVKLWLQGDSAGALRAVSGGTFEHEYRQGLSNQIWLKIALLLVAIVGGVLFSTTHWVPAIYRIDSDLEFANPDAYDSIDWVSWRLWTVVGLSVAVAVFLIVLRRLMKSSATSNDVVRSPLTSHLTATNRLRIESWHQFASIIALLFCGLTVAFYALSLFLPLTNLLWDASLPRTIP